MDGYNVDRFFIFYPIHLKVRKDDLDGWKRFFKSKGRRFHMKGEPIGTERKLSYP